MLRSLVDSVAHPSRDAGGSARVAERLKRTLMHSVRVHVLSRSGDQDSLSLPLRVRPAMLVLTFIVLALLGLLGFHPTAQKYVYVNDKVMHFFGFMLASVLFYLIWDVDDPARRVWFWRHAPLMFSFVACILCGAIGSEFVQSLLPDKVFQWGDIIANLLGSTIGLYGAVNLERSYRSRRELEELYAPLDVEDYAAEAAGDDGEDDVELERPAGAAKKTRFGNVWDDQLDDSEFHASTRADPDWSGPSSQTGTTATNLFSIDDEDE